jgi:hypothetical protein
LPPPLEPQKGRGGGAKKRENGKKKEGKEEGRKKRARKWKRSEMHIFLSFSLLVDMGGFIGG